MALKGLWEHVEITGVGFNAIVAVATTPTLVDGIIHCLWELRPFYYHLLRRSLNKWLTGTGRRDFSNRLGGGRGCAAVLEVAARICPALRPFIVPSRRQQDALAAIAKVTGMEDAHAASAPARGMEKTTVSYQETMVSLGWLLPFLLHFSMVRVKVETKKAALDVLQILVLTVGTSLRKITMGDGSNVRIRDGMAAPSASTLTGGLTRVSCVVLHARAAKAEPDQGRGLRA